MTDTQEARSVAISEVTNKGVAPERVLSLGGHAARGVVWLTAQTVAAKGVGVLGTIVLAWLLSRKDFGLVAMAYTVNAFAGLVQQAGLREILIQRQKHFRRWSTAAFWLSLLLGTLAGLITMACGPIASKVYHAPGLSKIIFWVALSSPLGALSVVPMARLQADLRFKALSGVGFAMASGTVALNILFAWLGWGAYSFVVPRPIIMVVQGCLVWWLAPQPVRRKPMVRRWRYLWGDGLVIIATVFFYNVIAQGDYMTLGVLRSAEIVGVYYFAFNLSLQTVTVFTLNLWGVLMPSLSKLQDEPARQLAAFLKATRLISVVIVPASLLQAAAAAPLMRLFFAPKWVPAIPVLQALSVGMMFSAIGGTVGSLLQARGQFKTLLWLTAAGAALFMLLVVTAGRIGEALAVGIAVGVYHMVSGPISLYVGIRGLGGSRHDVLDIYLRAVVPGVVSAALGWAAMSLIPQFHGADVVRLITVVGICLGAYVLLIAWTSPSIYGEAKIRAGEIFGRARAWDGN